MVEVNKAFVLKSPKVTFFEDRDIPRLRSDHDVRVYVEQTGICGSDTHFWNDGGVGDLVVRKPIVLGHESSGIVVEVGSQVKNVKVGDRVAIEPSVPCRYCDHCRAGDYNICPNLIAAATPPFDGTLQTFFIVASDFCYLMPAHMTAEDGALVEPLAVAIQAAKIADLRGGQTVLVFGCGPVGLLCAAVARNYGAKRIVCVDISSWRAEFAKTFAADDSFVAEKSVQQGVEQIDASRAIAQRIMKECGLESGADVIFECSGAEACIQAGVFATRSGGIYVQVGAGPPNVLFPMMFTLANSLQIRTTVRYTEGCYSKAVDLIASGKVDAKSLISHRFAFDQSSEAFETVVRGQQGTLKVMIQGVQR